MALVLLAMGLACLPCALHLVLLPRRRAWAQAGLVAAAMLVAHPLLGPGGAHAHAGGPAQGALGAAMVLVPALGLGLAGAGLLLAGRGPRGPRHGSPGPASPAV
ncbi:MULTISPECIES: hypothetical protein [unclassified Geodermatophilus]|uniref:hypothetical protein n=1 Tax=unclassified Geodermatophilus TaxID=2637632 RepID=UPI003EEBE005